MNARFDKIALGICFTVFVIWIYLLSYKFFHFGYYDWDLALFAQGMWNLCHGSMVLSLFGTNIFANHANLIALFLIPLYKIFPFPLTLVFLKLISLIIAGYFLYLLAKERFKPLFAIVLMILYFIYTPNIFGLLYEFDFESLAPAFLMVIYYFYIKNRWIPFLITAAVLMLIKENMPLIIMAFSFHALLFKQNKLQWAIVPSVVALLFFCLAVLVIIPLASGQVLGVEHSYYIAHNYKSCGGSISGLFKTMLFHPIKIANLCFSPVNKSFLIAVFNPLMYLPLFCPGVLILIVPVFLQHLLSASPTEHYIKYAYVLTLAPFLFISLIEVLSFLFNRAVKEFYLCFFLLIALNLCIICVHFNSLKDQFMADETIRQSKGVINQEWELVHLVPKEASVIASFTFLAALSHRHELYPFYKVYHVKYNYSEDFKKKLGQVKYALIDTKDPWLKEEDDFLKAKTLADQYLNPHTWRILKQYGQYILYQRKNT